MVKNKHIITIIVLLITLITTMTPIYAGVGEGIFGNYFNQAHINMNNANQQDQMINAGGRLVDQVIEAIGILQIVGAGLAVIMIAIYGFKFFYAGPQQKAAIKSKTYLYLLGIFLLLCGPLLLRLIVAIILTVV